MRPSIDPAQARLSPISPPCPVTHLGNGGEGDEHGSARQEALVGLGQYCGESEKVSTEDVRVDQNATTLVGLRVHISLIADQKASASWSVSSSMTICS